MTKKHNSDAEQYRLLLAPDDFTWSGERAPSLPIIMERDGAICEPLLRFFGWSHRFKRVAISSMRDEAYILREWKAYLDRRKLRWDLVGDQVLIDWREHLNRHREMLLAKWLNDPDENEKPMDKNRITRKLAVVFLFYDKAQACNLLKMDLVSTTGPVTCHPEQGASAPLTFSMAPNRRRSKTNCREWACAEFSGHQMTKRPIPDDSGVSAVLTHLRNNAETEALGNRDWLIGKVMAAAGLRADEVAKLTPRALEAALAKERIRVPTPDDLCKARTAGWNPSYIGLDAIAEWETGRQAILGGLDRLERSGRPHIYVRVTGKGNVTRDTPFPIDLVRDLITIGIWDVRMRQLQRWSNTAPPPGPPQMFLSEKTRKGLKTKPIGNLAKNAFNACKVEGSGHRLRAYFATNLAQRRWATYFTDNMFRWDQTVENRVLVDLAQALGHASPTTACRHYLDLGRAAYFHLGNKSQLKAMRMACDAMATHHRRITPEFFQKVARLIELRGGNGFDGRALDEVLDDILEIHADTTPAVATTPDSAVPAQRGQPSLRMVPKNTDV